MPYTEKCPKCAGIANYITEDDIFLLSCMCGWRQYLEFTEGKVTVYNRVIKSDIQLPKTGTKLSRILNLLVSRHPDTISTGLIAATTQESVNDVGSRLMVLYNRQLTERVTHGKGIPGGSTWVLSTQGALLFGLITR